MTWTRITRGFLIALTVMLLVMPEIARACATCFAPADDPVATGLRMAVLSLIGVTGSVLGAFGAFFIFLYRKSRSLTDRPRSRATGFGQKGDS